MEIGITKLGWWSEDFNRKKALTTLRFLSGGEVDHNQVDAKDGSCGKFTS